MLGIVYNHDSNQPTEVKMQLKTFLEMNGAIESVGIDGDQMPKAYVP